MLVTELGIVMLVNPLQLEKAPSPILVTELGIVMLVNPLQLEKAPSPILVTESGIVTSTFTPETSIFPSFVNSNPEADL
jgi:hypothetical protein